LSLSIQLADANRFGATHEPSLDGATLKGHVVTTLVGGEVKHEASND
jgi:hypothetical protein